MLVQGAYDLHVHVARSRRIDDVTLARQCAEVGLAGFAALKSHYTSTAERATCAR